MLDWNDLRFFLAIARHRTLARAARELQVTHSTVNRRLTTLQDELGVRLVHRTADGFMLTLAGESILAKVERLETDVLSVERTVASQDTRQEGLVRVASSQMLTSHLLAPSCTALYSRNRDILIELLADMPSDPPASEEVHICVQLRQFEHHDLVVRKIGEIAFGLYCCVAYLGQHDLPDPDNGYSGHKLIVMRDDTELPAQSAWIAEHASRAQVGLKADSYETQHWLVTCGGGIAVLPRFRADAEPSLHRIATAVPIPKTEIWLGVHKENRAVPRVRTVLDCIADTARHRADVLNPQESSNASA